jgi:hypothetical protein
MHFRLFAWPILAAGCLLVGVSSQAQFSLPSTTNPGPEKKYEDFDKFIAGAKSFDGLFKLHQKDEHLFAELKQDQLDKPYLAPTAVARGGGLGGHTLNFEEQWVILFRRVGEKIHVVRRNVRFKAKSDSPAAKAVETTYTDSILLSVNIKTVNPKNNSVVIDFNDIFFGNFAQLPFGEPDRNRTVWHKIKTFPKNIELQVAATFPGSRGGFMSLFGDDDNIIDGRGNTVIVHYGLCELPDSGYKPRIADDRVGYFLTAVKDFSGDNRDTAYVRYVNRWRLERADGTPWKEGGKLSPPKKKIVFWIEKSVPDEYRAAVREGILEWNKAYEKIGFRDAIEVRQQETEDFDPEDINYNTFRWITSEQAFAMGPSRANPLTGELIDADIIFDASMIRAYKTERRIFKQENGKSVEVYSPIQAMRQGLTAPLFPVANAPQWNDIPKRHRPEDPDGDMARRYAAIRNGLCQSASFKHNELGMALAAMSVAQVAEGKDDKLPDEMILQAIKEVVMHEVGHTLGLRHNFKASTMLKNDQLHDTSVTRKQGLVASVMDYTPVNLAPKGAKQGDYFTTTIGAYDYWAIEYGYKPLTGDTEGEVAELKKIAERGAQAGLDYGTDEDMMSNRDPLTNVWDLGADPLKFGIDRIALAESLIKGLSDRVVDKGEGYQRLRTAFSLLLQQYANGAYLASQYVGGEYCNRDHKGDPNARDPFVPVKGEKQRESLKFLQERILNDATYQFPPELLRKLASDRWMHWGAEDSMFRGVEFSLNERILGIQRSVISELLNGRTLSQIQNLATKAEANDKPVQISEIFTSLTTAIFADLPEKVGDAKSTVTRRNLQRDYLARLSSITLKGGVPADARSLARFHLKQIDARIEKALADKNLTDDTIRAHLSDSQERIKKTLAASISTDGP